LSTDFGDQDWRICARLCRREATQTDHSAALLARDDQLQSRGGALQPEPVGIARATRTSAATTDSPHLTYRPALARSPAASSACGTTSISTRSLQAAMIFFQIGPGTLLPIVTPLNLVAGIAQ